MDSIDSVESPQSKASAGIQLPNSAPVMNIADKKQAIEAFKELLNQAHNKSGHVKEEIPKELEKNAEGFYLFNLNIKDQNVSDKSFLRKFIILLILLLQ